jgi:hypothetical protein
MKVVICEPVTEYRVKKWNYKSNKPNFNFQFVDIKDGYALFHQPSIISSRMEKTSRVNHPVKIKLSSLRGEVSKQTIEQIDQQLKELRGEWERNI